MEKTYQSKLNTIIVPAQLWGFQNVLMEKNMWYVSRIDENKIKEIKYIAFYQTSPESSITYYSKVKKIIYNKVLSHFDVFFSGKPIKIKSIKLDEDKKYLAPQRFKYTTLKKLLKARKISDIFGIKQKPYSPR